MCKFLWTVPDFLIRHYIGQSSKRLALKPETPCQPLRKLSSGVNGCRFYKAIDVSTCYLLARITEYVGSQTMSRNAVKSKLRRVCLSVMATALFTPRVLMFIGGTAGTVTSRPNILYLFGFQKDSVSISKVRGLIMPIWLFTSAFLMGEANVSQQGFWRCQTCLIGIVREASDGRWTSMLLAAIWEIMIHFTAVLFDAEQPGVWLRPYKIYLRKTWNSTSLVLHDCVNVSVC